MILDDFFADRQAQPRALGLTVRGKRFKQAADYFEGNTRAGIFEFGEHFMVVQPKAEKNGPTPEHDVRGIADEIVKNPAETLGIQPELGRRHIPLEFDAGRFKFGFAG